MMEWTAEDIEKRIRILEMFRNKLTNLIATRDAEYANPDTRLHKETEARRQVNELIVPAKEAILMANVEIPQSHTGWRNSAVHLSGYDPFTNLFQGLIEDSMTKTVMDCTDRAIGFYRLIHKDPSMDFSAAVEGMEIRASISRSLRFHFRDNNPGKEKDVQDAIEAILTAIGVSFTRDKEAVEVGGKSYKPDFAIKGEGMAIEVKLAKDGHGASKIQEQISADIHGYQRKWPRVLFVIYDLGTIKDPEKMRLDNEKTRGVFVEIVKP